MNWSYSKSFDSGYAERVAVRIGGDKRKKVLFARHKSGRNNADRFARKRSFYWQTASRHHNLSVTMKTSWLNCLFFFSFRKNAPFSSSLLKIRCKCDEFFQRRTLYIYTWIRRTKSLWIFKVDPDVRNRSDYRLKDENDLFTLFLYSSIFFTICAYS